MQSRLIAALCVSWLAGSTALVVNPKRQTVGVESKANASLFTDGRDWSPQIYSYIQYLEDLEAGGEIFIETSRASASASNGTVLFVVLSDSGYYANRLKWISETWGQDLPSSQLLAIGDFNKRKADTTMRVEPTRCPAHTHDGACCKMAEAIITAHHLLQQQPTLGWAYIVDDDAYVRPAAMQERLKSVDPKGEKQRGAMAAIPGCQTPKCPLGFCGGGGAALSREALATLVGHSPAAYLKQHMETCQRCEMWGDVTVGTQAYAHDISVKNPYGLNGWLMEKGAFDAVLKGAYGEPLMYHYMRTEGQMKFLHRLFHAADATVESEGADLLARSRLVGWTPSVSAAVQQEDVTGAACASYKGNKVCSSDPKSVPWGSM